MLLKHSYKTGKIQYTVKPKKCITHVCMNTCMESTPTHNLWLWPKRPPLVFLVAETFVAEMAWPKRPRTKCPRLKCPTFWLNSIILDFLLSNTEMMTSMYDKDGETPKQRTKEDISSFNIKIYSDNMANIDKCIEEVEMLVEEAYTTYTLSDYKELIQKLQKEEVML